MVLLILCVLTTVNSLTLRTVDGDDLLFYWKKSNDRPCYPFTTSIQQCNHCVCGADSVSYCTKFKCSINDLDLVDPTTVIKSTTIMSSDVRRDFNGRPIYTSASEQNYD